MSKSEIRQKLDALNSQYGQAFRGEEIVFGEGCISSPLIIVGEAPGKDEVKQGKPFVGAAGKNLNEFIETLGIGREDIYITNTIKYRLGRLNEKTQRVINRPASKNDILINQQWLHREIEILKPHIIVTLGNVPLKSVADDFNLLIGDVHGKILTCSIKGNTYKLFPLYHPASIIYNRALKPVYNRDLTILRTHIETLETNK